MTLLSTRDVAKALADALRARRKTLGISMAVAAEAAAMSRVTWHRLEKGETGVAWGYWLAAVRGLGLDVKLLPQDVPESATGTLPALDKYLPLTVVLDDFPGLARLAWAVRAGRETLSPREAWQLYDRNARHLQGQKLLPREQALIRALGRVFGDLHVDV